MNFRITKGIKAAATLALGQKSHDFLNCLNDRFEYLNLLYGLREKEPTVAEIEAQMRRISDLAKKLHDELISVHFSTESLISQGLALRGDKVQRLDLGIQLSGELLNIHLGAEQILSTPKLTSRPPNEKRYELIEMLVRCWKKATDHAPPLSEEKDFHHLVIALFSELGWPVPNWKTIRKDISRAIKSV